MVSGIGAAAKLKRKTWMVEDLIANGKECFYLF